MVCNVRLPSRRGGWRSRERGAVGRRAAVRGVNDGLDQANTKGSKRNAIHFVWTGLSSLSLVLLLLVFSSTAYAAPSIEVDGNFAGYENGETYKGYIVVDAPNEYIATLTLIGEYSALPQIDSDMYAKLSNESSGGRFYQLVQEWEKIGTPANGSTSHYVSWGGSEDFQAGLTVVYGYGRVWECTCTDALKSGAKEDFLTILDGGSLDDGEGQVPDGQLTYTLTRSPNYTNVSSYWMYIDNIKYLMKELTWETCELTVTQEIANKISTYYNDGYSICISIVGTNASNIGYVDILAINSANPVATTDTNKYGVYPIVNANNESRSQRILIVNSDTATTSTVNGDKLEITYSRSMLDSSFSIDPNYVWRYGGISERSGYYLAMLSDGTSTGGGNGGSNEPGDNNWPTDDTPTPPSENPPSPPTINPPSSPNPPTITPHNPTVPTNPTNEPDPTGTSPTDYTPWLRAILQQLVNLTTYLETCFTWLGTALDDHCQHIRDHMTACSQFLGDYVVASMSSLLGEHHSFLNGLAQWIVDNLRWENSGGEFDDSNMIYWLRRIYARQGSGEVNSRPVDPATDYSGFAGWLGILYDAVALDVSDTSLVALTSSLSGLQHTFPFSLPWDIRQVLQALDVAAVTPSFSIPVYGVEDVSYDIDLHWMDSAMISVRAFELLVFIVYVMVHTKDLFGYLMGG